MKESTIDAVLDWQRPARDVERHESLRDICVQHAHTSTGTSRMSAWISSSLVAFAAAGCKEARPVTAIGTTAGTISAVAPSCVEPYADAFPRMRAFEPEQELDPSELIDAKLLDLDGDGQRDLFITARDWCGTGGCPYWIYVSRGDCSRFVGQIEGKEIKALGVGKHELTDITSTWWLGCCSKTENLARYDGQVYRVSARDCTLATNANGERSWTCTVWAPSAH